MAAKDDALRDAFRTWEAATYPWQPPTDPPVVTPPVVPPPVSTGTLALFTSKMRAAFDKVPWASTAADTRFYYDTPLALLRMFALTGDVAYRAAAIRESAAYRASLTWNAARTMCWPSRQPTWTPAVLLDPAAVRYCYAQGQLAELKLTGNTEARAAALGLASTMLAALPKLLEGTGRAPSGGHPAPTILEQTERSLAFAIYNLDAGTKLQPATFAAKTAELVSRAIAWNARSATGGFDHPLFYHDAAECELGYGTSSWMGGMLIDACAMAAPQDPRVAAMAGRFGDWLAANRVHDSNEPATAKTSFVYLSGCQSDAQFQVGWWCDLIPMVVGAALGHALRLTGAAKHRALAEEMIPIGLENMRASSDPKHWAQTAYLARWYSAA